MVLGRGKQGDRYFAQCQLVSIIAQIRIIGIKRGVFYTGLRVESLWFSGHIVMF